MSSFLLQKESSPKISAQSLHDLDLPKLLSYTEAFSVTDPAEWLLRYFTQDEAELSSRLSFIDDLRLTGGFPLWNKVLTALRDLISEIDKENRAKSNLDIVIYGMRKTHAYLCVLDLLAEMVNTESARSERFKLLKAFVRSLCDAPQTENARAQYQKLSEFLPLPASIDFAINTREDLSITEIGLLSSNGACDPTNSLISANDFTLPANALAPEFIYNSRLYGYHIDEYINQYLEKEWKSDLNKASRLLSSVKLTKLDELTALEEDFAFYCVGLELAALFEARGIALCLPKLSKQPNIIACGKNMLYPELCMTGMQVQGNDITLRRGENFIITGANHSGKTSFLKTLAQSLVLGQLGFPVPAESFEFSPVARIFTLFSSGEDDSMDYSRMGIEIQRISEIISEANAADLVLFNEPLTSTNPLEAISICADLCQRFIRDGITLLLVTHLYDVYFLLRRLLSEEEQQKLISLITESTYDASSKTMQHRFKLRLADPEGNSYARETALSFGITMDNMLSDQSLINEADGYLAKRRNSSMYDALQKKEVQ